MNWSFLQCGKCDGIELECSPVWKTYLPVCVQWLSGAAQRWWRPAHTLDLDHPIFTTAGFRQKISSPRWKENSWCDTKDHLWEKYAREAEEKERSKGRNCVWGVSLLRLWCVSVISNRATYVTCKWSLAQPRMRWGRRWANNKVA